MLAGLRAAHHESAAEKFLVMQFLDGPLRLLDRLHLHESEPLGTLIMAVAHYLGILHVPDAVKQLEQVALGGVEGEIAHVKTRRSNFDSLWFPRCPGRLCTI